MKKDRKSSCTHTDDDDEEELEPAAIEEHLQTAEQLSDSLISLSLEPKAKWQNLLNLETIKVDNCIVVAWYV